jgi:hypothetical protein
MIARSALAFSGRNILDRVRQPAVLARLRRYARLLFGGGEPPLASTPRRFGDSESGPSRWQHIFAAYSDWSSVPDLARRSETRSHNHTERLRRYCRDCEEDTAHEQYDELGLGWYAQICRCRRCGREGMSVWPLACW